jgi:tRNA threonylcarbamoyladenosine biosynthesis protein TsaE
MTADAEARWSAAAATRGAEGTRELAAALARLAEPGDVVLLVGGLGAGKTTFAQGFARGLGVNGPVTSPTFTLVRQYRCEGRVRQLVHADVYRLDSLAEVADLGLVELAEPGSAHHGAVVLVEWGDVAAPALGDDPLVVTLAVGDDDEDRTVTVAGSGGRWAARRAGVAAALATATATAATTAGEG